MEALSRHRHVDGKGFAEEQGLGAVRGEACERDEAERDRSHKMSSSKVLHAFWRSLDFTLLAVRVQHDKTKFV